MTLVYDHETDLRDFMHIDLGLRLKDHLADPLDRLTDEIVAHDNRHVPRRAELRECLSMVVANLLRVYCSDPLRLLNLPYGRSAYTTSRYIPPAFPYRKMIQVRKYLLIDNIYARFAPGYFHEFTGNSRQSKLRCTPRLSIPWTTHVRLHGDHRNNKLTQRRVKRLSLFANKRGRSTR
jgi:hypothetical protein